MKNTIKKFTLSLAAVSMINTTAFGFFGGFDGSSTLIEQLAQTKQLIDQTTSMSNQLIASTGIRNIISFRQEMGDLMEFMDNYSLDFMDLTNDIVDNPRSQVGQYAKRLFEQFNLFDDCQFDYMNNDQKRICKSQMVRNVQEISTYQHTNQKLKRISEKLSELSNKRTSSEDVKQTADIANAIQMQIAQLQIIKAQVDLMESQNRAKRRVDQRQIEQLRKQRQNKTDF